VPATEGAAPAGAETLLPAPGEVAAAGGAGRELAALAGVADAADSPETPIG
jgi:hypothetical protein